MASPRASEWHFHGVAALVFLASAAATVTWGRSMAAMGGMPMPGGWTMSMAWMRRPGQSWPGAAGSFLGMWVVMMAAMMLPSLVPMLRRYRRAVDTTAGAGLDRLTLIVGLGYLAVWTLFGLAIFPLGVGVAELAMRQPALARAVPVATGMAVLLAGVLQFTSWKARHLVSCLDAPERGSRLPAEAGTAWRHGLCLGVHCSQACAGLTLLLLVGGVMDLTVMAVIAAAITVERAAPGGVRVTHAIGAVIVVAAAVVLVASVAVR